MTNAQDTDQRFAWIAQHGGPDVDWDEPNASYRHLIAGEGLSEWFASDRFKTDQATAINKHVDEDPHMRMLDLRSSAGRLATSVQSVFWSSTLKVSEGRYVRVCGDAADFPTALAQVEAYTHESRQMGGLTWWQETENRWISWLGAFNLSATRVAKWNEECWHFEVKGEAPTLEEAAMLATLGRLDMTGAAGGQGT
ncbi:hypothetical protein NU688_33225 [Variovorax sp. ZS18.2.2]|uniref:hypothetical protein n=1 Tax=Variovorax sp. ZS18.2.2 TaxID=2971255 RepID=UPI0021508EDD|nr:hypothetical protein [Variovorax sp. ZS18.2.2]MCR6481061.1 hypothetical protein [Variovorax sp. ZS18.2.2]